MIYDKDAVIPLREGHFQELVRRLQEAMTEESLDALIMVRPDYINWLNTHQSLFLEAGGQGMTMIVLPQSGAPTLICVDHEYAAMKNNGMIDDCRAVKTWTGIEYRYSEPSNVMKYASPDSIKTPEGLLPFVVGLQNVINEKGLLGGRIGIELGDLKLGFHQLLTSTLDDIRFVDSISLLKKASIHKTPYDIYHTRYAAYQQWANTHKIMMGIKPGDTYAEIRRRIERAVAEAPDIDGLSFLMLYMGKNASSTLRHFDQAATVGDLISVDLGFESRGYMSDSGRAYVLGPPTDQQLKIASIYNQTRQLVKQEMKPGARLGDLYDMAAELIQEHQVSDFKRGHIGHGLGCGSMIEEFPFILSGADTVLEPNMVMTLEIPFYGWGFGAYFEEDILLITEEGNESLTSAPFGLNVISV